MKTIAPAAMAAIEAGEAIVTGAVEISPLPSVIGVGIDVAVSPEIGFVGEMSVATGNGNATGVVGFALTGGLAATPAAGDLVIIQQSQSIQTDLGGTAHPGMVTAGYTKLIGPLDATASFDHVGLDVYYKVMGATPDTTWESDGSGNSTGAGSWVVTVWRGINTSDVLASAVATLELNSTSTCEPPDIDLGPASVDPGVLSSGSGTGRLVAASFALKSTSGNAVPMVVASGNGNANSFGSGNFTTIYQQHAADSEQVNMCIVFGSEYEIHDDPTYGAAPDPIRLWGGYGPITFATDTGDQQFGGAGARGLAQQNAGAIGGVAQGLTLSLSGLEAEALALLDGSELKSASVVLYRLIFASDGKTLLDAHVFDRGRVDTVGTNETIGGTASIDAAVESSARGLGRKNGRMRADSDQRLIDANDGYFKATAYAAQKQLYWGGKRPYSFGGGGSSSTAVTERFTL